MGAVVYIDMGLAKVDINPISTFLPCSVTFQFIQFILTAAALGLIYGKQKNSGE